MRILTTLLSTILLAGCASIPLTTAARLSTFDQKSVSQLDPAQIRVRVATPIGFELDAEKTKLSVGLSNTSGAREQADFSLSVISKTKSVRSGGLFSSDVQVTQYDLTLTPESVRRFATLQRFAMSGKLDHFHLNVSSGFSSMPMNASHIRFWADVKLKQSEPYMTLFDGAEIEIKQSRPSG